MHNSWTILICNQLYPTFAIRDLDIIYEFSDSLFFISHCYFPLCTHLPTKLVWVEVTQQHIQTVPDNKVHGANMGPIWGRQDPGGPHIGPMNFAIWGAILWKKYRQIWPMIFDPLNLYIEYYLRCTKYNTTMKCVALIYGPYHNIKATTKETNDADPYSTSTYCLHRY